MASSLRNFFITFVLALLVFGALGWHYYPDMLALLPGTEEDTSVAEQDTSEVSGTVSRPIDISIPETNSGEGLGILNGLVVMKNDKGEVMEARFLRFNSERRIIVSCTLSLNATVFNEVNVPVPLQDYLRIYPVTTAANAILSLTGYTADFYLELTPNALQNMIVNMEKPTYFLRQEIRDINPIYAENPLPPGEELPANYYQVVESGQVELGPDQLSILLAHYRRCDGTDGHESMDRMLADLYTSLLQQIVREQKTVLGKDAKRLARVLSGATTNLNDDFLGEGERMTLLFRYTSDDYIKKDVPYTTHDATLHAIKLADQ